MIQVGDRVICIKERYMPKYIGSVWTVLHISPTGSPITCALDYKQYTFHKEEIVLVSSLLKELM